MTRTSLLGACAIGALTLGLAACGGSSDNTGGGSSGGSATSPAVKADVVIKIVHVDTDSVGAYQPNPATAHVGDTVEWDQTDSSSPHTVDSLDSSEAFSSGANSLNQGETFQHKFTKAGTFNYHCNLHANMKGTITVS